MADAEPNRSGADGAIDSDPDALAYRPDVLPPRIGAERTQHVTLLLFSPVPGLIGSHAKLTVKLLRIVMVTQRIEMRIGRFDLVKTLR